MKRKIVVITDFSANACKAAEVAMDLAERMDAEVVLFHAYMLVPYVPSTEDLDWVYLEENNSYEPESTKALQYEAERLKKRHADSLPHGHCPVVSYRNDAGVLPEAVTRLTMDIPVTLLVMGKTCKPYRDIFFGSDTHCILHSVHCPVLIMPEIPGIFRLKSMVFATDLSAADLVALRNMDRLFAGLDLTLTLCHICEPVRIAYAGEDRKTRRFDKEIAKLHNLKADLRQVFGTSVLAELSLFALRIQANALAFSRKQHTRLAELLHRGELLEDQLISLTQFPVLVFPPAGDGAET